MSGPEIERLVDEAVSKLMEHCDAVEILVTVRGENQNTLCAKRGAGNWYARMGMARELLSSDTAQENARAIGEVLNRPDDGSDDWKEASL